ncbi:MAG: hypothetical protein O4859_16290 [Trichodesmium sp. St18_bin1]|nr:hypothetical protein [Trichodesmium sp. St18_bin1]
MIDLTQENIQKIFVHMINCHEVKYNVKDWSKIYKTVCNQKLSIQEVHKIAQHISQSNMNTKNVVTERMILKNLNQCKTEAWEKARKKQIQENPYLK